MWSSEPFSNIVVSGATYSANAQQFFDRVPGLNPAYKPAYAILIDGLNTDGIWAKLDGLWIAKTDTETTFIQNLVSSSWTLAKQGATTFTPNTGVATDGTSGYYDTTFNPSTSGEGFGGQFGQNHAHIMAETGSDFSALGAGFAMMGAGDGTVYVMLFYNSVSAFLNTASAAFPPITEHVGQFTGSRIDATTMHTYSSVAEYTETTDATIAVVSRPIFLLARNLSGTANSYSDPTVIFRAFSIGGTLSATNVTNFNTRIATFMAAF